MKVFENHIKFNSGKEFSFDEIRKMTDRELENFLLSVYNQGSEETSKSIAMVVGKTQWWNNTIRGY